jgi:hypothetical protein
LSGFLAGDVVAFCRWPGAAVGVRAGLGWSGRSGRRVAGGLEEAEPVGLAVPAVGQVQGEVAAAVAGGAGGDVDEVAAQGGASGLDAGEAGQGPGGAQQVVADGGAGEPGGVGGERARRQVGQGPVSQVREDLLDDGVFSELGIQPLCG